MTNAEFESFLELSIKNFGENYIDYSDDLDIPFNFSAKFEKKMDKLIKRQRKPYYALISTAGRRAACIAAAIIIASGSAMSVKAIREKVIEFVVEHWQFNDSVSMDNIIIDTDTDISYPEIIEQEYTIDIPEGFEIVEDLSDETAESKCTYYVNGDKYIDFAQTTVYDWNMSIDNERCKIERRTDVSGVEYIIYFWEDFNKYNVIWENNGYIFRIITNYDEKEIIDLCHLTKKK